MKSLTFGMCCLALCLALVAVLALNQSTRAGVADKAQADTEQAFLATDSTPLSMVQGRCAACHPLQRICSKLGFKDLDQWTATVTRMVQMGIPFTDEDIARVSQYLSELPVGDPAVCE